MGHGFHFAFGRYLPTYLLPTSAFFPGSPFVEAQFDPAYGNFNLFSILYFFAFFSRFSCIWFGCVTPCCFHFPLDGRWMNDDNNNDGISLFFLYLCMRQRRREGRRKDPTYSFFFPFSTDDVGRRRKNKPMRVSVSSKGWEYVRESWQ